MAKELTTEDKLINILTETFGFHLSKSYLTGLLISGVLLSILILVVWTDKKNKFWVTRYLDPFSPFETSNTTTWQTKCKRCNEFVNYNPSKLLLETKKQPLISTNTRIISLTCTNNCKLTFDYEFPKEFTKL